MLYQSSRKALLSPKQQVPKPESPKPPTSTSPGAWANHLPEPVFHAPGGPPPGPSILLPEPGPSLNSLVLLSREPNYQDQG